MPSIYYIDGIGMMMAEASMPASC